MHTTEGLLYYFLQDINEELDLATESFLEGDACKVDLDKKEVSGMYAMQRHLSEPKGAGVGRILERGVMHSPSPLEHKLYQQHSTCVSLSKSPLQFLDLFLYFSVYTM